MINFSTIKAVLTLKCPGCRRGNLFHRSNPYIIGKLGKMYENCPVCNQKYVLEPGFYFGAAMVSYGTTVVVGVGLWILSHFVWRFESIHHTVLSVIIPLLMFVPYNFVLSRSIWLAMFVRYNPDYIEVEIKGEG